MLLKTIKTKKLIKVLVYENEQNSYLTVYILQTELLLVLLFNLNLNANRAF